MEPNEELEGKEPTGGRFLVHYFSKFEETELSAQLCGVFDELKTSSNFPQKLGTLDDLEIPSKLC